jgi:hypothetical protein
MNNSKVSSEERCYRLVTEHSKQSVKECHVEACFQVQMRGSGVGALSRVLVLEVRRVLATPLTDVLTIWRSLC